MIRQQFLQELWELLAPVPEPIRRDWMYDYEEHFRIAVENGQSEEAAAVELGDPRQIAKELLLGYRVEQAADKNGSITHVSRAVLAAVSLGFFNLIFVLGPYIALLAVLISFYAVAGALCLSSLAAIYESVWGTELTYLQGSSLAAVLMGLGILTGVGTHRLARAVARMTLNYLRFNSRMITRGNKK
ncbi:DUF1700 domain-containing protein [Paenibacillus oenotherae]|uniref:DUF1700 domain-containing protein n=1 Tax=Paenibacillus oenotherae TaxID=1435645 RepID=A0ABS7D828_9BACL|nr:DUF1700 domain-containing protein [Paenibacillus oenotherae]MBW7476035.1 DUF1700 domain-containing protein [Paenibacillus oenotherae]